MDEPKRKGLEALKESLILAAYESEALTEGPGLLLTASAHAPIMSVVTESVTSAVS